MVGDHRFPSLASIRAFEAAARLGSFAQAAHELSTTAASVSYHVRQLEKQVGVTLFRRHPHRVELTAGGQVIATEAMNAFAALRASFTGAADLDQSHLSLTTLPTIGTSWLTPKLGGFRARHPDIKFELELSADAQDLTTGRFDAAIRNGNGRWPGLRSSRLFPSIFMPLCSPALKDAARGLGDPRRALDVPLLGRTDWWSLWYRALGVSDPPLDSIRNNLFAEYLDITQAIAGHGIAIGSPILFKNEIDSGRLMPAHDLVASDGRVFWFTYPVTRQDSRKIVQFREWLCGEAESACAAAAAFICKAHTFAS
jgi:LysR family transcriptional regulator, glycine cleavage system transcriptional activator